jgi:hypothetical protein
MPFRPPEFHDHCFCWISLAILRYFYRIYFQESKGLNDTMIWSSLCPAYNIDRRQNSLSVVSPITPKRLCIDEQGQIRYSHLVVEKDCFILRQHK